MVPHDVVGNLAAELQAEREDKTNDDNEKPEQGLSLAGVNEDVTAMETLWHRMCQQHEMQVSSLAQAKAEKNAAARNKAAQLSLAGTMMTHLQVRHSNVTSRMRVALSLLQWRVNLVQKPALTLQLQHCNYAVSSCPPEVTQTLISQSQVTGLQVPHTDVADLQYQLWLTGEDLKRKTKELRKANDEIVFLKVELDSVEFQSSALQKYMSQVLSGLTASIRQQNRELLYSDSKELQAADREIRRLKEDKSKVAQDAELQMQGSFQAHLNHSRAQAQKLFRARNKAEQAQALVDRLDQDSNEIDQWFAELRCAAEDECIPKSDFISEIGELRLFVTGILAQFVESHDVCFDLKK